MEPKAKIQPAGAKVVISVNPKSGAVSAEDRVARLVGLLKEQRIEAACYRDDLGSAAAEANRLHATGELRALVAVGGDGTAAELVNRTQPGVPLTLLPAGNENLLARHFGMGPSAEECCHTLVNGQVIHRDAGRAGDRIFLLMFSCGFDANVVHSLHAVRTGHINSGSYISPILNTIQHYDYPELRVAWSDDGGAPAAGDDVRWLFAFNLPCYGAGLQIAPEADGCDGLLDVCTFRNGGLMHGLLYASAVLTGTHRQLADFAQRRCRRLRVTSEKQVPYQLDGDPGGFLPVEVAVLPRRLTLMVPKTARDEGRFDDGPQGLFH
jgi:diacylglycerol kinase (ATP)